jgi:hypothetical protein
VVYTKKHKHFKGSSTMPLSWLKAGVLLAGMCGLSIAMAAPQAVSSVSSASEHSSLSWTQAESLAAHTYLLYGTILQRAELKIRATPKNFTNYRQYQAAAFHRIPVRMSMICKGPVSFVNHLQY